MPHRDFLTFYGPGNLWIVGGAFEVFGESVGVERAVGLLYRLVIVLSLFVLGLRLGGILAGVSAALVASTIMADDLIWAYATYGALAFGLLGLALLAEGAAAASSRLQTWLLVAAGVASGVAALVRFDFGLAIVLGAIPILALTFRHALVRFGAGLLATLAIYAVHLAIVGPARIHRVVEDLLAAGSGRYLQRQTIWDYPGNLLAVANLAAAGLVCAGAFLAWRNRRDLDARVALSAGLFSLALLPLTISRMDPFHIRPYAIVPLSLLPGLVLLVLRRVAPGRRAIVAASLLVAAGVVWGAAHYGHYTVDHFRTVRDVRGGYRGFYDDDSAGARVVVERARRLASARRRALRRPARPPPHELRSDLHVLPASRAPAGVVLHGDESRAPRTERAPAWPTSCAGRTGSSSRASGTTGTSRTTRRSTAPRSRTRSCATTSAFGSSAASTACTSGAIERREDARSSPARAG